MKEEEEVGGEKEEVLGMNVKNVKEVKTLSQITQPGPESR